MTNTITKERREAIRVLIRKALQFSYWAAGEGIGPTEGQPAEAPDDFLVAYSDATGDGDWEALSDQVSALLDALDAAEARAAQADYAASCRADMVKDLLAAAEAKIVGPVVWKYFDPGTAPATWHPLDENGHAEMRVNGRRITTFASYPAAEEAAERINAAVNAAPPAEEKMGEPVAELRDAILTAVKNIWAHKRPSYGDTVNAVCAVFDTVASAAAEPVKVRPIEEIIVEQIGDQVVLILTENGDSLTAILNINRALELRDKIEEATLAAPHAAKPVIPEGWVLVPSEPTKEMVDVVQDVLKQWGMTSGRLAAARQAIEAALAAAPALASEKEAE